ncbi:MAG TPA: biopolymer transporter ExbD [Candidatus Ozemobacteraceae bacterium]|nr:biopolymer transporter ExbD [Candidatus Ozemobacteraceae bacterium]
MKKLLPERRREKPQIVVTNLIDVILLLVFFFMITSSFANDAKKLPVELPKASSGAAIEGETLSIQVDREGTVMLSGAKIDDAELAARVTEYVTGDTNRPVLLEADEGANYGIVIQVLDKIRIAGGVNVGLSTKSVTNGTR